MEKVQVGDTIYVQGYGETLVTEIISPTKIKAVSANTSQEIVLIQTPKWERERK